jgi:hypothetical protein
VKGLAFRTVMQELGNLEGPLAVARSLSCMPPELAHRFKTSAIVAAGWYPIADYAAMWGAIQEATGNRRELPRIIGRKCVEHDLNVVHKLVFRALSVPTVIGLATRVFNSYYDTGKSRAELLGDRNIRVWFEGCKGFNAAMWGEIRGSVECFGEQASGGKAWSTWKSGATDQDADGILDVWWK